MSTYLGYPIYDQWEHAPAVVDGPTGRGGRTEILGDIITKTGKRVHVHSILAGATANGGITFLRGDGVTPYFANAYTIGVSAASAGGGNLDMVFEDGLTIGAGTAGSWIIVYRILN